MAENRIADGLLAPDSNTRRFHAGAEPQAGLPPDMSKEELAALDVHRSQIKAPRIRGRQRQAVPRQGLVITDSETGAMEPLKVDERGKLIPPKKAEVEPKAEARPSSDRK